MFYVYHDSPRNEKFREVHLFELISLIIVLLNMFLLTINISFILAMGFMVQSFWLKEAISVSFFSLMGTLMTINGQLALLEATHKRPQKIEIRYVCVLTRWP